MQLLIPSQLAQKERIEIYKFLIDSQIKFKKEPGGDYSSIIHCLNPFYYTDDLKLKSNHLSIKNQTKPQSPSVSAPLTNMKQIQKTTSDPNLLMHRSDSDNHLLHSKHPLIKNKQRNSNSIYSSQRILNYNEAFSQIYPKFYAEVKPMIGIRGKKYNIYQLKVLMEEIYSIRFIHDTTMIKNHLINNKFNDIDILNTTPFPIFVYQYLRNKYSKKPAIDQWALNMLLTIEHFKTANKEVEIFAKLLSEEYNNDDLVVFLFAKSGIEKEIKKTFIEKAQNEICLQHLGDKEYIDTELYISSKSCFNIACLLFGNNEEMLIKGLMKRTAEYTTKESNFIQHSILLFLIIEDYHQRKIKPKLKDIETEEKSLINLKNKLATGESNFFSEDYSNDDNDQLIQSEYPLIKLPHHKDPIQSDELFSYSNDDKYPQKKNKTIYTQFYQSLVAFYQNELESNGNQKDHMLKAIITDLLYTYIQEKEIDIFFEKLFTCDTNDPLLETKLPQIKQLILTKISLLINIISSSDKNGWFTSLKITPTNKTTSNDHFDLLNTLFINIAAYSSITSIPEEIIEKFCSELLMTNELIAQITKLIKNNCKSKQN